MRKINTQEVNQEQGHCGLIRKLSLNGPARIINLIAKNAERHFHRKTTEYYYVLHGQGQLFLDGDIIDIRQGDLVRIDPGVVHQALEQDEPLEILVIEIPPAIDDVCVIQV